ncbi:helix-turn-helix transcriptional regulator [Halosimplex amylolyticum]|uniref:helix-turn-helix transcriptional regulator n=1 Tax=Halosimplex amylolyticum TaxID=3396616 RepID=UPI003F55005B
MSDQRDTCRDDSVPDGGTESFDASADAGEPDRTQVRAAREKETEMEPGTEQEFLLEVVRRGSLLEALRSGAAAADEIVESVDMSRSTVHRATKTLEKHDILEETNGKYELTSLGEIIAAETERFETRIWTAVSLKQFLNPIDVNGDGIPVEYFADAKMTRRRPRQPHTTIHRISELIENSDDLRMFSTVISPIYVDVGYREMMDGMEIQAIFDRDVLDLMLTEYPEKAQETISTGNFDLYAHDGLPFELFLFDDKMGMAAHDENGNAEVLVECDDPSAIEWAEDVYSKHLSEAEPLLDPSF